MSAEASSCRVLSNCSSPHHDHTGVLTRANALAPLRPPPPKGIHVSWDGKLQDPKHLMDQEGCMDLQPFYKGDTGSGSKKVS